MLAYYTVPLKQYVGDARPRLIRQVSGVETFWMREFTFSAVFGGSRKETNENFLDRSEKGLHVNSSCILVQ